MNSQRYEYLYTDNAPDTIKCAKCHNIPERVYRDSELELLFCQNCRSKSSMYDTYLQTILDQCHVMCPNKDCDLICKRGELLEHLADDCDKQVMPCQNSDVGCKWYSIRQNHSSHECEFDFLADQLRFMMESIKDTLQLKNENEMLKKRITLLEASNCPQSFVPVAPAYLPPMDVQAFVVQRVEKPKTAESGLKQIHDKILSELQQRLKVRIQ